RVAVSERALDLHSLARPFARHPFEILDEPLLASGDVRIVLDVVTARISRDSLAGATVVEHELVEGDHVGLVGLEIRHVEHSSEVNARTSARGSPTAGGSHR